MPGASPLARALDEDEADIETRNQRERERERERESRKRRENRGGNELSRAISFAERSSFGSANAPVPRRNRKLRLGFHLRCCAPRVGARLGGILREKTPTTGTASLSSSY